MTSSISARVIRRSTTTISDRGIITEVTERLPKWSALASRSCSNPSMRPSDREAASTAESSAAPSECSSESTGRWPRGLTSKAAARSRTQMAGAETVTNARWTGIVQPSVRSGSAMARFLGTSSPNSIWSTDAPARATSQPVVSTAASGTPTGSSAEDTHGPMAGSARMPSATLLRVIPNWAPDIWRRRSVRAVNARRAPLDPPSARACSREVRLVTSANSVATNTELMAIRATTAARASSVIVTGLLFRGPRPRGRLPGGWLPGAHRRPPPRSASHRTPPCR